MMNFRCSRPPLPQGALAAKARAAQIPLSIILVTFHTKILCLSNYVCLPPSPHFPGMHTNLRIRSASSMVTFA
jgi:hypothetical protein